MRTSTKLLAAFAMLTACTAQQSPQPEPVSSWAQQATIYEVNIRQYTPEGTFKAFTQHLPRLKKLGADILWLMPINPISEEGRKGTLGSYYSVANYKAVNPQFGSPTDLHELIDKAHQLGMKVIIDWVANHTGCDNEWTIKHPDWYIHNPDSSFYSPYDWTDTYKLDYNNKAMRLGMIDALKFWVDSFNIDGFRCDVAYEVPNDFWIEARQALDSIRPLFMLAESEQPALQRTGAFDMCYNWPLKNLFFDIAHGKNTASAIDTLFVGQENRFPAGNIIMNHLTNHDLNSWDGSEFVRFGEAIKAFAVLTYTLPGMPLLYTGQEVGMNKTLQFFEKDTVPSWTDNEWTLFYTNLNTLRHNNPSLNSYTPWSKANKFNCNNNNVLAFERTSEHGNSVITIVNLSEEPQKLNISIPNIDKYNNYFNPQTQNLPDTLQAWNYLVLTK